MRLAMYNIFLQETDLIDETHFPAIALINEAFNSDPLEFVNNLSNGIGSGYNYSNCSFWDEFDDYDKSNTPKFDGLRISTEDNEELILPIREFIHYLETACDRLAGIGFSEIQMLKTATESLKSTNNG